jgi:hypothetical protein
MSQQRTSVRLVPNKRESGVWQEIPLTPTPNQHKPHPPPPSHRPAPPMLPPTRIGTAQQQEQQQEHVEEVTSSAVAAALGDTHILDRVLCFLSPEELGRCCSVSRVWRERVEQDELWHPLFRAEWQQEVNPSPGTFKRWYGAMRSAALSWTSPILQQDCVKHESFSGRVEIRVVGSNA